MIIQSKLVQIYILIESIFGVNVFAFGRRSKINSMQRDTILMNKILTALPLGSWSGFSLLQCTTICLIDMKCTMVFYNSNLNLCKAFDLSFNAAKINQESQIGWQFYHRNLKVCPTDAGYVYDAITDKCIRGSDNIRNYTDARQSCVNDGASLVRIDSNQMWNFVKGVIALKNIDTAYIQGELDNSGVWRYDDGTPITFIIWGVAQPDEKNEKFLILWKPDNCLFHDVSGNINYGYVCEIKLK